MKDDKIVVGLTIGDVNGIGPELLIKVFQDTRMHERFIPVIYGSIKALTFYKSILKADRFNIHPVQNISQIQPKKVNVLDVFPTFEKVEPGVPSRKAGALAHRALEAASDDLLKMGIDCLVTLPIDKATIQSEQFQFPGHTEYLAKRTRSTDYLMLMVYDEMRVAVVTGHIPIAKVAVSLNEEKLTHKLRLLNESLKFDFNIQKPKIAVLGLNPHAGDAGLLGREELEIIIPVIKKLQEENLLIHGPFPADGFFATKNYKKYDAILSMYHDQGLIPFKALSMGFGVNFTAGLPIIRTSPDHGTAYDIAGKGRADETSTRNAIYAALDIYRTRLDNFELYRNALRNISVTEFVETEDSILIEDD